MILPCLDEAPALPWVLGRMPAGFRAIVVDNGSADGSESLARSLGATVVREPRQGFGAALADTLHTVLAAPARRRVLVLDGAPGPWLPPGFDIAPQCGGGLDERLAAAFAAVHGPALLIGMDTPQLTPSLLIVDWEVADAWFGPAADGGFWALGLRVPDPALVRGVPMSAANTGASQRARLHAAGLRVADLPRLRDVDTAEDALAVARLVPRSRFAARVRELVPLLDPATATHQAGGAVREQV